MCKLYLPLEYGLLITGWNSRRGILSYFKLRYRDCTGADTEIKRNEVLPGIIETNGLNKLPITE